MKECNRCLLNESVSGVKIQDDGECNVCHHHDKVWGNWNSVKEQQMEQLKKLFDDCKKKNRAYDVLVPLSGGKDSSYVLYQCAKVFKLKCLAVTWDNGFLSEYARKNIRTVVDTIGADHSYYRVNSHRLKQLYRKFFMKTGMFCPVCMRGIGVATASMAEAFNIPLVVNGTCLRHEEYVSPQFFNAGSIGFFKEVLKGEGYDDIFSNFCYNGSLLRRLSYYFFWWSKIQRVFLCAAINLPDYMEWNYENIVETLQKEANWRISGQEKEHEDCIASPLVAHMRQKKFPALKPELLRYSKLVTSGVMTREEALSKVAVAQNTNRQNTQSFQKVFELLGISEKEFYDVISDPLQHEKYVTDEYGKLFRTIRTVKRFILYQN